MIKNKSVIKSSDFTNSIGVDTHFSYFNTAYANQNMVLSDLAYLGVTHVRDVVVPIGIDYVNTYEKAMTAGIRFDSVIPINMLDVPTDIAVMSKLETAYPGGIEAIEGINESSPTFSYDGLSGNQAANAFQGVLYKAVQASPELSAVQVYNFTVGADPYNPASYTQFASATPQYTRGNVHDYVGGAAPNTGNWFLQEQLGASPNSPYVVTETGYDTMPGTDTDGSQGVNDDVQARYMLDDVFDLLAGGASKAYIYELLDELPDPNMTAHEQHFGLFNNDGTPKEAAVGIHNLTSILADTGSSASTFETGTLSYTLTGLPSSGNSMLLQKSSGSFDLAVWAEPAIWNTTTLSETAASPVPVTLQLGEIAGSMEVYDPLVGTSPIARYDQVSQIILGITDHPLVVEVDPLAITQSLQVGNGTDKVTLKLSEDFYQGDAQFVVAVDGVQIGGVQTATALHSSGQDLTLNVLGNFGAGQHKVSVDFLNDAYGGSAATDRNLYVDGTSYNGVAGGAMTLLYTGTVSEVVGTAQQSVVNIGSGYDTVALKISEDYFQGDAQFTVAVDGKQIGGVQTASAPHSTGQDTTYSVMGNFGGGQHAVTVYFLNDASGSNLATQDRNLYVDGASYDGVVTPSAALSLYSSGPQTTTVGTAPSSPILLGSGTDTISLQLSEDYFAGNAQFTVSVDGQQFGGVLTASALHGSGQEQTVTVSGNFGFGRHNVSVNFLNDAYDGSPRQDRNLYVASVGIDGVTTSENYELTNNGSVNFVTITATTYSPGAIGGTIATLGNDTVNAGTGFVTISTGGPTTVVNGGSGGMKFFGNTGSATVTGGSGTDTLIGSGGNLSFIDGTGATTITAGPARELYTIVNGQAGNTLNLYGFNASNDKIHLQGYSGSGITSQQVVGGSTQIVLTDNTKIVLHNVTTLTNSQMFA